MAVAFDATATFFYKIFKSTSFLDKSMVIYM